MESEKCRDRAFDGRQLTSWKEIAAYLGVSVRTAQKWELERSLPVHRLPGGRGMVLTSVTEIESWLRLGREDPRPNPDRRRLLWFGGSAAVCFSGLGVRAMLRRNRSTPSGFRVEGENLVVVDDQGLELWRKGFGFKLANGGPRFRLSHGSVQCAWFGDIYGDQQTEFLFFPIPEGTEVPKGTDLYCFSATGTTKWQFRPGGSAASFLADFHPPYYPLNLLVIGPADNRRIVLASVHHTWHPSQIAILSGHGKLLKEYWHAGHLIQLGTAPKKYDGGVLILAGGVSNGYKSATLVALDPDRMAGFACSTEESAGHQLPGERGQEAARILFPRSQINLRKGPYNVVFAIRPLLETLEVGVVEDLDVPAEVIHTFGPDLGYVGAGLSSNYLGRYAELEQQGLLRRPLVEGAETRNLSQVRWLRKAVGGS